MILLDANVLLYASDADDVRHAACREFVESCHAGDTEAAVTSGILAELVAGLTWPRRARPIPPPRARAAVTRLTSGRISVLPVTQEGVSLFARLVAAHALVGQDVHDAHHAALALAAGCDSVATFDVVHWERFAGEGLEVVVPGR